ncbi:MAG TPA: hypothetical protein VKI61_17635 [Chitinophagaceae bacterium]|jgi:hypothetical protein|nr:hypothetical protein [Chitinophagaceae bacterium]
MKKIMTIAVALAVTMTVAAQHGRIAGSRVVIVSPGIGFGYGYSPFYYSPFGYPFGYPYGYNNNYRNSSKLQSEIEDVKSDYKDKIWSAKQDKSLSREDRDKIIHQLKSDRNKAVEDLKTNYYKPKKTAQGQQDKG